jgi:hypothetical protein
VLPPIPVESAVPGAGVVLRVRAAAGEERSGGVFAADLVSELLRNQLKIFVCAAPARAHPRRDWRTTALAAQPLRVVGT